VEPRVKEEDGEKKEEGNNGGLRSYHVSSGFLPCFSYVGSLQFNSLCMMHDVVCQSPRKKGG